MNQSENNRITFQKFSDLWLKLAEAEAIGFLVSQASKSKENSRLIQDFIYLYEQAATVKKFRFAVATKIYNEIGNSSNAEIDKINTAHKIANAVIALGDKQ